MYNIFTFIFIFVLFICAIVTVLGLLYAFYLDIKAYFTNK